MARTNAKKDSPKGEKQEPRCDPEQLAMLKRCSNVKDITEWNLWRIDNPDEDILLEEAVLEGFFLKGAWLCEGPLKTLKGKSDNLTGRVNLKGADLWGANLEGADLSSAHMESAALMGAHMESAALRFHTGKALFGRNDNPASSGKIFKKTKNDQ